MASGSLVTIKVFQMMIEADALLASASIFSYVAPSLLKTHLKKCYHLYFYESGIHGYLKGHHVITTPNTSQTC